MRIPLLIEHARPRPWTADAEVRMFDDSLAGRLHRDAAGVRFTCTLDDQETT